MEYAEIIAEALGTLAVNKLRTTLATLGIVIGIGSVIALVSLGQSSQKAIQVLFPRNYEVYPYASCSSIIIIDSLFEIHGSVCPLDDLTGQTRKRGLCYKQDGLIP